MTDDVNVSQHVSQKYRELGAQEPPRALDEAILAAARRSARPWTQRWAAPLSLAAVIVLSVTVTLRIQHEQPGIESPVQPAPPAAEPSSPVAEAQLKLKAETKITRRKTAEQPAPAVAAAPEPKPFAADQAVASARSDVSRGAASSVTGTLARQVEERTSRDAEAAARVPQVGPIQALAKRAERAEVSANLQAQKQADTPERELERIAQLRRDGRHDEADKALAEFRKRYPDYRIPEAMRERVERR